MKKIIFFAFIGLLAEVEAQESLGKYNVDIKETSVSGLSSGAFFAVQLQVAHSSIIKGVGIVAGGPFNCAADKYYFNCMYANTPLITNSVQNTLKWSGSHIDSISNLSAHKVYMLSGTKDLTVSKSVMNQLYSYYVTTGKFISASNVHYESTLPSAHTFPTDFDSTGNNACGSSASPYISNCQMDGAGAILGHIYGSLNPRAKFDKTAGAKQNRPGRLITFKQSEFLASPTLYGMDANGYLYVPSACEQGAACRLHIAFHGCAQSFKNIGLKYVQNTGFDKWAYANNLIILYPQAYPDNLMHTTPANGAMANGNACWDWLGWYGADFQSKTGKQISTIKKMIDQITSGVRKD